MFYFSSLTCIMDYCTSLTTLLLLFPTPGYFTCPMTLKTSRSSATSQGRSPTIPSGVMCSRLTGRCVVVTLVCSSKFFTCSVFAYSNAGRTDKLICSLYLKPTHFMLKERNCFSKFIREILVLSCHCQLAVCTWLCICMLLYHCQLAVCTSVVYMYAVIPLSVSSMYLGCVYVCCYTIVS